MTPVSSWVRQPKDNASSERFNRTLQEEWLSPSLVGLDNISQANLFLTKWFIEDRAHRPHQALDYQTPLGYAQERFFKVLPALPAGRPMWSASTQCLTLRGGCVKLKTILT
ncbi:MAG: integrase core domain-containing protein [Patescibacteria group bacterium]